MSREPITTETRREVERLLDFSAHVGGISEEDVLEVLSERGITTLPEFVGHALAQPPVARPSPISGLSTLHGQAGDPALSHRPPRIALVVDGVEYDPADITRFDGRPLTFALDETGPTLHAFTDGRHLRAAAWAAAQTRPRVQAAAREVQMFEHHHYGGDWFWLQAGYYWPNLAVKRRGGWPTSPSWNDTISSMSTNDCHVAYYDHIDLGGDSLHVRPYQEMRELDSIGWNDRISSVINYG
ncbi:hypothetical protein ACIBEJ_09790 [Nonomuraea sp. NPDC050790]|uniref:hypothetical protein n=1 Tax=Nonomuraea sp. NPDC050790 TaxID=3364371 RepID=UPI0037ACD082